MTTYSASLVVLPEKKIAAAVLSSGGSSDTDQLMASKLLLALKEKGEIKNIKSDKSFGKPVRAKIPQVVVKQAGYYTKSGSQFRVEITEDGVLSMANDPGTKYIYFGWELYQRKRNLHGQLRHRKERTHLFVAERL